MDLHRLKTYISESVHQYQRLEKWASSHGNNALAHSHRYSAMVGLNILEEIKHEEREEG